MPTVTDAKLIHVFLILSSNKQDKKDLGSGKRLHSSFIHVCHREARFHVEEKKKSKKSDQKIVPWNSSLLLNGCLTTRLINKAIIRDLSYLVERFFGDIRK